MLLDLPAGLLVIIGIVMLVGGAYYLVEGASRIASAFGISDLVIGLTIVAIGTSTPELAIVVVTALQINAGALETIQGSELIIGNVVGSNIANIGLILGFSAATAIIGIPRGIIRRDFPWLVGATVLVGGFGINGSFEFLEGVVLFIGFIAFSMFQYQIARRQSAEAASERKASGDSQENSDRSPRVLLQNGALVLGGGLGLAFGSDWLVNGASTIARDLGISEYLIGLTLLAVGTSLPELSTSVLASARGEGEIVVGNIIGSNIYNLFLVLSAGTLIVDLEIPDIVREVQIPLMVGLTMALVPIFTTGTAVSRREGIGLLIAYIIITGLAFVVGPGPS